MKALTWSQVHSQRLRRNHLREPAAATEVQQVARDICGVQAQVMGAAEYALGARLASVTQTDVQRIVWEDRSLIKTWGMRGTLHLLVPEDHPMWAAAMLDHPGRDNRNWYASFGLDAKMGDTILAAMSKALDGRVLSRDELATRVADEIGDWVREPLQSGWGDMLAPATYQGVVCFGPSAGTKVSFARRDQWSPNVVWPYEGEAFAEILRAYLHAYAPVVPADIARWFAMKMPRVRELLDQMRDELATVTVEGRECLVLSQDARSTWDDEGPSTRLLPQYDAYVLGCGLRDSMVPRPLCDRIFQHGRGRYEGAVAQPILVIDGVVSGMWSKQTRRGRLQVTVESFTGLSDKQRKAIADEAERVASFYELSPDLTFAELTASR